jgi:hypothetical protein
MAFNTTRRLSSPPHTVDIVILKVEEIVELERMPINTS